MKRTALLSAMLLAAAVASAQATPGQANPQPTPGASQQTASGGANQAPANAPEARKVLQAKSQDELKAYQDASAKTDPAQAEAAAADFSAKFPTSELRAQLYVRAMNLFAQANDNQKVIAVGRQAIAADPLNPIPLVQVASALAETTHDSDLDREQELAEAAKDAHAAIDNIDTGLLIPPNATPEQVAAAKHSIMTMAYDTLGMVDMRRNEYASAESNLQKAIEENKNNPEAVLYLRLSVVQDKLKKYPQALDSANRAVEYARDGTPAQNLAKQQQERLRQLISAGSSGGQAAQPATAPSPAAPGGQSNPSPMPNSPNPPQ